MPCESKFSNRPIQREVNPHPQAFISAFSLRQCDLRQQILRASIVKATDDMKGNMPPQNCSRLISGSVAARVCSVRQGGSVLGDASRAIATGSIGVSPHGAPSRLWTVVGGKRWTPLLSITDSS
jgi:hypothetical protein